MMSSTAAANPVPCASVNSGSPAAAGSGSAASERAGAARCAAAAPSAHGTTESDTIGAAAMPSATGDWPSAIPTATASANRQRESPP